MLLSDRDLHAVLANGELKLTPHDSGLVQPSSVDVRLADTFLEFDGGCGAVIDPRTDPTCLMEQVKAADGDPFVLPPGGFALGSTVEWVTVGAGLAARVEGKSSLARLGLSIHTAGFIDPGFAGRVTLELFNHAPLPIKLWPGMRIGQLCVFRLSSPAARPYGTAGVGRYQHQQGPTASRMHEAAR